MFKITLNNILRTFLKYINISIINLLGLVIAFTVFIYIGHYVLYERSFDSFWEGEERIYRIANVTTDNGVITYDGAKTPGGIYYEADQIPEVEACGFSFFESNQVKHEPNILFDQKMLWVTDGFQDVFDIEMLEGTPDFARKCTGVISESKAKVLFGDKSPIGEILKVNEGFTIEITGVYKDIQSNTHIEADYFCSWPSWKHYGWITEQVGWGWSGFWTYFKLKEGADPDVVEEKLAALLQTHLPHLKDRNRSIELSLQPLSDIHFDQGKKGDFGKKVDKSLLINLALFGLFILVVAWINYINLSTALAIKKERSIGIQRLVGAEKKHQLAYILLENFLFNLLASLLAWLIFGLTKELFSIAFNVPLSSSFIPKSIILSWYLLVFLVGFVASSFYSSYSILKINPFSRSKSIKEGKFQKALVIVQLCVTITFISMSLFIYRQIKFVQEHNLGMEIDNVVVLSGPTSYNGQLNANGLENQKFDKFYSFRQHLMNHPNIITGSALSDLPGSEMFRNNAFFTRSGVEQDVTKPMGRVEVDNEIIETLGLRLLAGNDFSSSKSNYYKEVVISRKAQEALGFASPQEAVGAIVQTYLYRERIDMTIKGVVEDFHFEGLHKELYPIVFTYGHPTEYGYYAFRVNTRNMQNLLSYMRTSWEEFYPEDPFNYFFQDEYYNRQYESDQRMAKFNIIFAAFSVFISCLGLYGIILFYLARKRKEIGIRKVNGAPIADIMLRLNTNIFIWLAIALVISIPLSIYLMHRWLENFAYKTTLSWWIFAVAALLALLIALITVSWQSWKASIRNPIEALRYE